LIGAREKSVMQFGKSKEAILYFGGIDLWFAFENMNVFNFQKTGNRSHISTGHRGQFISH